MKLYPAYPEIRKNFIGAALFNGKIYYKLGIPDNSNFLEDLLIIYALADSDEIRKTILIEYIKEKITDINILYCQ